MTDQSTKLLRGAFAAVLIVALASPAMAALDTDALKCRASISKFYGKLIGAAGKTLGACHKSRNLAKNTVVDCNNYPADALNIDPKGKITTAAGKLTNAIATTCAAETELMSLDYFASCPEPCATTLGLPNPMTTLTQVGECLSCLGPHMVAELYAANLGTPTPTLGSEDAKCHAAIAKGYQKYIDALIKGRQKCQGDEDKLGNNTLTPCETSDPKDKGLVKLQKADEGIDKLCVAPVDLSKMDSCASTNLTDLKACLGSSSAVVADEGFTTGYEMPITACPTTIQTVIRAGCSTDDGLSAGTCLRGGQTDSTLSVGWSGFGHGIDLPDHYSITGTVDCPGSVKGACGECNITGLSTTDPQYEDFSRCKQDPSIKCDPPFQNNPACPSGGMCSFFLGAPLAVSAAGAFTCTLNALSSDVVGTADPDAGSTKLILDMRSIVSTGEGQTQPCPLCVGDTTPQDGNRNGTCVGGARNGLGCDVQAFDVTFADRTAGGDPGRGVSLDCPLPQAANISGQGLVIDLQLTTGTDTLTAENVCDAPYDANMCFCGQCTGNVSLPCRNDAECAAAGAGTCTDYGGAQAAKRQPNSCAGYVCDNVGATDRGECGGATQLDMFCGNFLRANGLGIITCQNDGDCESLDPACGGDCGLCDYAQLRSCFLNPIVTSGTPDTVNPVMSGLFCLPPTNNVSINETTGSPGPGLVKVDSLVHLGY